MSNIPTLPKTDVPPSNLEQELLAESICELLLTIPNMTGSRFVLILAKELPGGRVFGTIASNLDDPQVIAQVMGGALEKHIAREGTVGIEVNIDWSFILGYDPTNPASGKVH